MFNFLCYLQEVFGLSSLRALRSLFQQLFGIGGYLYDSIGRLIYQSTVVLKIFKQYYFLLPFETEKELKLFSCPDCQCRFNFVKDYLIDFS